MGFCGSSLSCSWHSCTRPAPFSLLETGQPGTAGWCIKDTGVRPGAAPRCWEMFTSWRPALPDDPVALLVMRNGAGLKVGGFTKGKQQFGANSALSDSVWGSPGVGAGYRILRSFCSPGRSGSKMGYRCLEMPTPEEPLPWLLHLW